MPDPAKAERLHRPGRVPGDDVPARPWRVVRLLREAILGDPGEGLLGPRGPLIAGAVTAFYVVTSIGLARWDIAVSFAIVPLVIAALTLPARPGMVVAIVTFATVLAAETVAVAADLDAMDMLALIGFAFVSLALRLVVVRLTRGGEEIAHTATTLAATRAQVDEAREATERWVGQLEVVQRAAARMAGRPSVREVAETVADEIRAIVDYHACRVYVLEEPDDLVPVVSAGENGYETIPLDDLGLKVGEGFTGWVAANGRPLLVPDANADPRGITIPGTDEIDESMVLVPMRYDERVTGVLALSKTGLRQFDLADVRVLSILADQAATAIESAKAIGASSALAEDLRRVADMSSALSRSLDPRQVADLMASHVGRAFGADECGISYWDRPADRLLTWGYWPPQRIENLEPSFALEGFPETRRVLETQTLSTIDTDDPAADPAEVALLRRDGQRTLVMVPLVAKGETIGLVELCGTGVLRLDARRIDLVRAMANEAAMALANAQLYETTRALADRDPLDGLLQPPLPPRAAGGGDPAGPADAGAAGAPDDRPRRLQAGERHPGPSLRRRGPALVGGADPRGAARLRHRGPVRRRRVRGDPAGHARVRRPRCRGAHRRGPSRPPVPSRGPRARGGRRLRRRGLVPRRRPLGPDAHRGRRRGALPGQERRRTRRPGSRPAAPGPARGPRRSEGLARGAGERGAAGARRPAGARRATGGGLGEKYRGDLPEGSSARRGRAGPRRRIL